MKIHHKLANSD